jgi:curved DNA-binding protein CbpA
MFAPNATEIKGTFQESPFAELLIEVIQAELSGSFRLSNGEEKVIIYLKSGEVIFAVSNLRQHRLFEMLLQTGRISKDILSKIPNFANDFELAEALIIKEVLTTAEVDEFFINQIKSILMMVMTWHTGSWNFNHLARAKEGVEFKVETTELLVKYARSLPNEVIIKRFKSFEERFGVRRNYQTNISLLPAEAFVLSRMEQNLMKVHDIKAQSGFSDLETLKVLYVLWSAGIVVRKLWNCVFTEIRIQAILTARLTLKKEAAPAILPKIEIKLPALVEEVKTESPVAGPVNERKQLDTYLKRVEAAESYYEILDISITASSAAIKTAYFGLAKQFHPDKFHHEANAEIQRRVQDAFTEIARAYETLKDESSREVYDFKLRKYLESVKSRPISSGPSVKIDETDKARQEFEQGFSYLMEEEYEEALPYLTRAAQMAPDNARYRAYHGKALSIDENQRHKAEAEIQMAIKLDSNNSTFRIMLAEFFIQYNLLRRAEGELQRLLVQFPNNREAQMLLDSLQN